MNARLRNGWQQKKLADVATVSFSTVNKKSETGQRQVLLCNYMDVWKNSRIRHGLGFMQSTASDCEIERFRLQRGDVLITKDSETREEIAQPSVVEDIPDDLVLGYHLALIRPNPTQVHGPFLAAQLAVPQFRSQFVRAAAGATRYGLKLESVESAIVTIPSLAEQRRIAEILNAVDAAIDATRSVIAQARRLKSAILNDLLTRGLPGERKRRRMVKGVGEIPSDWQVYRLDDMSDGLRPPLRTGPFGSSLKTEHFSSTGRPVLTIGSLGDGEIISSELLFVDEDKAAELRDYEVLPGDVVFSRVADVGRSATIPEYASGWIISSNLMRITLDKKKFDPWFLRQSLVHNPLVTNQVRRLTADGGRQIVTSEILSGLLFPMPPRKEQDAIAEIIRRVDQRLWQDREIEVQLGQVKSALSETLLTGNTKVKKGK